MEELSEVMSDSPLFNLLGYSILYNRLSVRRIMELSSTASKYIDQHRSKEGGRFRIDRIIIDSSKVAAEKLLVEGEDALDELEEDQQVVYPSKMNSLMRR